MSTRLRQWAKRMQTWIFLTRAKVYTRKRRLEKKSKAWRLGTLARGVEFLAVLIALIAFFNELSYRHEERTARAWQLLISPAPGNSGKGEALSYLNSRKITLTGIDLTPPILAEQWKGIPKEERELVSGCEKFTHLREVKLPKAVLVEATLVCADLQGADLRGAILLSADLRGARLLYADLRGAHILGAKLQGALLLYADLRGAHLIRPSPKLATVNIRYRDLQKLACSKLRQARNWETAYRDKELACGEPIPPAPTSKRSLLTPFMAGCG